MTAQETDRLRVEDRVQAGTRIDAIDFAAANVFLVKWEGRRDSDAYTREAFEKQFVPYGPNGKP
jgi:hypothetical protein